ncbi:MAG: CCA tRNA nucleotidyltransferase [Sulfurimonas sp.]
MINYPKQLDTIFNKLLAHSITPIIVGGYVRNSLLKIDSKDIDVELYGIDELKDLANLLKPFGTINLVGESFGVAKLNFTEFEIDFSLPRVERKISKGHKGFEVTSDATLDFKTAASRRDFTINAIGFDVKTKTILDPFDGMKDLMSKTLKEVDQNSFIEDPLRVLRAVRFCAIYNLKMSASLLSLCKDMVRNGALEELAKERIFEEYKKIVLNSQKPSTAFGLLKSMNCTIFGENFTNIDNIASITESKTKLAISLALICYNSDNTEVLYRLTNNKQLITSVLKLLEFVSGVKSFMSDYEIYKLASKATLKELLYFAKTIKVLTLSEFDRLYKKVSNLGVLSKALAPLLGGDELIKLGLSPSKEFSNILSAVYELQMRGELKTHQEAIEWVKSTL